MRVPPSSPRGAGRKNGPRRHTVAQVGEDPVVLEDLLPDAFDLLPQGGPPQFERPQPIANPLSALPPLLLLIHSQEHVRRVDRCQQREEVQTIEPRCVLTTL